MVVDVPRADPVVEPTAEPAEPVEQPRDEPKLGTNPLRGPNPTPAQRPPPGAATATPAVDSPAAAQPEPAELAAAPGESDDVPFDPIKENGPIFEGWSKPKLALVITGRLNGYLEPCGCAGLERMKGGLSRRHSMMDMLRNDRGWPLAAVDVGGLIDGSGPRPQAELKFQTTVNALQEEMKYDAIGLGKTDLGFSAGDLLSAGVGDESPFLSANTALFGFDSGMTSQKRIIELGGIKVGITSVLGEKWWEEVNNSDVVFADPEEKLAELVPALDQECDKLILLAHATEEESMALAKKFPQLDVVVTAGGPAEPPKKPKRVEGSDALFIVVGEKGMNAVVLGFYDDPQEPVRYQRVPLDSRFLQSAVVKKLMRQYQEGLQHMGLDGLGIGTISYPGKELLGKFVGSEKCKSCHEESYRVWKKSKHAEAWATLVNADPPRNFDPECIACHVVGWSPQNFRPFESGFLSGEGTPHLVNVGCETCHGPGAAHVKVEQGADFDLQEKLQKAAVITLEESRQAVSNAITDRQPCRNCHDLDNSPDFDFESYWKKIEHREE